MTWRNEGTWDRALRATLGIAMLAAGFLQVLPEPWNAALIVFAFVPLVTGLMGWCPLYSLLGLSTCRRNPR